MRVPESGDRRAARRRGRAGLRSALGLATLAGLGVVLALASAGARLPPAELVFNNGAEVATLDPAAVSGQAELRVVMALWEGLTTRDPRTLEPRPGIAERWDVERDGRLLRFHLRASTWSDGTPLEAGDFVWSWQRLLEPATGAPYAPLLYSVAGARDWSLSTEDEAARAARWNAVGLRAPDAHTLEVELERPDPTFLVVTSLPALFPVQRTALEDARARFPGTWESRWVRPGALVSNGPFVLAARRVNDRLRLVRNERYWNASAVALASVDVLAIEDATTALNLYLAGEIDWVERAPPRLVPALMERPDFHVAPTLATYFYRVNVTRPPFDDRRVRRALALAIDRSAIVEHVTLKGEQPGWSLTPDGFHGYPRPELPHSGEHARDVAEARTLLAEAGFPGGQGFPAFSIHFSTSETHRDIAEVVAAGWQRELGLEVRLRNEEARVSYDTQRRLDYEVSRSSWVGDFPDPVNFLDVFRSDGENNRTGWKDADYDQRLDRAAAERDPARRLELLAEAETRLLEELPLLPIYGYVTANLVDPRLAGFEDNLVDEHPLGRLHWKEGRPPERRPRAR
jgi:oligopeptide transport system substrate-binding protein